MDKRSPRKHHPNQNPDGTYLTPLPLAKLLVNNTLKRFFEYKPNINKKRIRILDPAVGKGVFLEAFFLQLNSLLFSKNNLITLERGHLEKILFELNGWDIQKSMLNETNKRLRNILTFDENNNSHEKKNHFKYIYHLSKRDSLEFFLDSTSRNNTERLEFDIIIGNPPYIRHEGLSHNDKRYTNALLDLISIKNKEIFDNLKKEKLSFSKQMDYYLYFLLFSYFCLKQGGILSFVIPTSWMNCKYGEIIRFFLKSIKDKITIYYSSKFRLFPNVKINTIILEIQKNRSSKEIPQQGIEIIDVNLSKNQNNDNFSYSENGLFFISRSFSFDELSADMNWETVLLRASRQMPENFNLLLKASTVLSKFAKVETGIYTGLNDFFYIPKENLKLGVNLNSKLELKSESKSKLKPKLNLNSELKGSLQDPESTIIPNKEFLFPVIRSPKEIKKKVIHIKDLNYFVFICDKSMEELENLPKYKQTIAYIKWGSKQKTKPKQKVLKSRPWPEVPSVKNRKIGWWALNLKKKPARSFLRYVYYENFQQPWSKVPIFSDRCYHMIHFNSKFITNLITVNNISHGIRKDYFELDDNFSIRFSLILSIVFNFEFTKLIIELFGRSSLGLGALKLETYIVKKLPILIKPALELLANRSITDLILILNEEKNIQLSSVEKQCYLLAGMEKESIEILYKSILEYKNMLIKNRTRKARHFFPWESIPLE